MFKSRIWKWGLDKKLKSDEVLAIMVLKRDRDAQNKQSEFTIRGQPVDMDNINRYIKRNPQLVARFRAGELPSMQTTLEVQCSTPSPVLLPSVDTSSTPQPRREVLVYLKEYIEESFYSGNWHCEYDVSCGTNAMEDHSDELFERMLTSLALANRCMARGDVIELSTMLDPAFEALKELVVAQSPSFAVRMICLLWYLNTHHQNDLLPLVVNFLVGVIPIKLGHQHLMSRIWASIAKDSPETYHELCSSAYKLLVPLLERRVGPANLLTTMLYGDHVDFLFHSGSIKEALNLCKEYIGRAEASGKQHPWLSELTVVEEVLSRAQREPSAGSDGTFGSTGSPLTNVDGHAVRLIQLGDLQMKAGETIAAIDLYEQARQVLEASGSDERLMLTALANLELSHTKMSNFAEAERIRGLRSKRHAEYTIETSTLVATQRETRPRSQQTPPMPTLTTTLVDGDDKGKRRDSDAMGVGLGLGPTPWDASPVSTSNMPMATWSPEVFMSPSSATFSTNNDWQFPM